jgi:hypothetical protein
MDSRRPHRGLILFLETGIHSLRCGLLIYRLLRTLDPSPLTRARTTTSSGTALPPPATSASFTPPFGI